MIQICLNEKIRTKSRGTYSVTKGMRRSERTELTPKALVPFGARAIRDGGDFCSKSSSISWTAWHGRELTSR